MSTEPESGSALGAGGGSPESGDWDAAPPPVIQPGRVVFGKYELLEMIGEGGMGQVWKVRHVELDSHRALKLIKPEIAKNAEGWRRFRREARVMDRLGQHPNSVAIYDFKRSQSMAYIEMAFVRGKSLDKVLKENGGQPMPLSQVTSILRQLCSVLQEAHSHVDEATGKPKPIVHRDLKPSNLMFMENKPEGRNLKVLDFGIAKMVDEKGAEDERTMELTSASVFLGTAGYASPEQIRGDKEIDGRSDLYSTGVILYQFLTGELPFNGPRMTMLAAHIMRPPDPMKEANPQAEVPPAVEQVVLRCLAKDPTQRYQTAAELFDAFSKAAGQFVGQAESVAARPRTKERSARAREARSSRSRWPIAVAAILLLGLLGGGVAYLLKPLKKAESEPSRPVDLTQQMSDQGKAIGSPSPPKVKKPPLPEGYEAVVDGEYDNDEYPKLLFRRSDDVRFKRISEVAYIPENYAPESETFHDWPDVIIRRPGNVRFIRIPDKEYFRGDPRAIKPETGRTESAAADSTPEAEPDQQGNSCIPHLVKVSAFYIQETEVTNGEIEDYLNGPGQDEKDHFVEWRESFRKLEDAVNDHKAARLYPAVCISYNSARKYAKEIGGRLPTEAEWELAAKSELNDRLYSWEVIPGEESDGPPKAHLSYRTAKAEFLPHRVQSYPTDKTEQNVYDMTGNVREWCLDAYKSYADLVGRSGGDPRKAIRDDPTEVRKPLNESAEEKPEFVVRGGSFLTDLAEATTFQRLAEPPDLAQRDLGFRVVVSCPRIEGGKGPANGQRSN